MSEPVADGTWYRRSDGEIVHECQWCGRWRADSWRTQIVFPGHPDETRAKALDWIICFACKGQLLHVVRETAKARKRGEHTHRWKAAVEAGKAVAQPAIAKGRQRK